MDEEDLPLLNEEPARRRRRRRKTQTCCGCFAWDTCKWILLIAAVVAGAWLVREIWDHFFDRDDDAHAEFTRVKATRYAAFASATYSTLNEVKAWDCEPCVKSDVVPHNITVVEMDPLFDGRVDVFTIAPLGEASKIVVAFRGETSESAAAWMGIEHAFAEATFGPQYANVATGETSPGAAGTVRNAQRSVWAKYALAQSRLLHGLSNIVLRSPRGAATEVVLVGHSTGGALATLAAYDLHLHGFNVAEVWTFGSPRVGDAVFANAWNAALRDKSFRVVNGMDGVVHYPRAPMFHHVGTEYYVQSPTGTCEYEETCKVRRCDGGGEDEACSAKLEKEGFGNSGVGFQRKNALDHLAAFGVFFRVEMKIKAPGA
jgi:hypothetical protein